MSKSTYSRGRTGNFGHTKRDALRAKEAAGYIPDRWATVIIADPELLDANVHVYPLFGRAHQFDMDCWCLPTHDTMEDNVIIHGPDC